MIISAIEQLERFKELAGFETVHITKKSLLQELSDSKYMSNDDITAGIEYFKPYSACVIDYLDAMKFVWKVVDEQKFDEETRSRIKFLMAGSK